MSRKEAKKAKRNSTLVFASMSIFLMVAPALASSYFGIGVFTVLSQSMKPYMAAGDGIVTNVVLARDVHIGDVVLVQNPKSFEQVSHRVVEVKTTDNTQYTITTKGDANPAADTPALTFNADASLRRVVSVVPKVGYALNSLSSTVGRVGGIVALIAYLVYLMRKMRKSNVEMEETSNISTQESDIATHVEHLVKEHLKSLDKTIAPSEPLLSGGPVPVTSNSGERPYL